MLPGVVLTVTTEGGGVFIELGSGAGGLPAKVELGTSTPLTSATSVEASRSARTGSVNSVGGRGNAWTTSGKGGLALMCRMASGVSGRARARRRSDLPSSACSAARQVDETMMRSSRSWPS